MQADGFIKGTFGVGSDENFKGCAVGCSLKSVMHLAKVKKLKLSDYANYEYYLGIPQVLGSLEDCIFEELPKDEAKEWPLQFSNAIPEGADLSNVWKLFVCWVLQEIVLPCVSDPKDTKSKKIVESAFTVFDPGCKSNPVYKYIKALYESFGPTVAYARSYEVGYFAFTSAAIFAEIAAAFAVYAAYAFDADFPEFEAHYAATAVTYAAMTPAPSNKQTHQKTFQKMAGKLCELLAAAPVPD